MNDQHPMKTFLPMETMNPRVLESYLFTQGMSMPKGHTLPKRYIFDYELEFFLESDGAMWIDDELFPIAKGDLVFRRPGQVTQAIMPYKCYMICFDMTGETDKRPENYDFCSNSNTTFQKSYINPVLDVIPQVFHPAVEDRYLGLFDSVLKEFINPTDTSPLLLKAYTLQIIHHLYRDLQDPLMNGKSPESLYAAAVKRAADYVRNHLDSPLCLDVLARQAGLSPTYFHKVFHDTMGITPNEFIIKVRLERAKELLVCTNKQIYKVAMECGIENIPYFSSLFKKHLGLSPQEFRKRYNYV